MKRNTIKIITLIVILMIVFPFVYVLREKWNIFLIKPEYHLIQIPESGILFQGEIKSLSQKFKQ